MKDIKGSDFSSFSYRVKAVVEKNYLVGAGIVFSDQDVPSMRIAMDVTKLVDHISVHLQSTTMLNVAKIFS